MDIAACNVPDKDKSSRISMGYGAINHQGQIGGQRDILVITDKECPGMLLDDVERILRGSGPPAGTHKHVEFLLDRVILGGQVRARMVSRMQDIDPLREWKVKPQRCSYCLTISPPTTVKTTFTFSISTGAIWKMSWESTAKSASFPGAMEPLISS